MERWKKKIIQSYCIISFSLTEHSLLTLPVVDHLQEFGTFYITEVIT